MLKNQLKKYFICLLIYILLALAFRLIGGEELNYYTAYSQPAGPSMFGTYYWYWVALLWITITFYLLYTYKKERQGRKTFGLYLHGIYHRYNFLIEQLVSRDFKTKYKKSVLGYMWSFLNPLMTSLVQYFVFSNLMGSDIEHFPAYLLTGSILFSFFTDSVNQGLAAIVSNAALITKVYVPKWIYPVTKVFSTSINLIISMVPLLLIAIFTGCQPAWAWLLLPYVLLCLLVFCAGLSLALSAINVFFRDTQYLWGIITIAWMYLTPLFYPESIIPERFIIIYRMNPLYQYIKFARTIILSGVSPAPMQYFYCFLASIVTLCIGGAIFKKTQSKFALYI